MYLVTVNYQNQEGQNFQQVIGVFSSESKANNAIEDFVEGVLLIEWPTATNISESIVKVELDKSIIECVGQKGY